MGENGVSEHSPCKAIPSSASSLSKEEYEAELEIKFLEAIAIYPPSKLQGIHRHFVLYGIMENLRKSFGKQFSSTEILELIDRFYDLEMIEPDDEDSEMLSSEEEFTLPESFFIEEESE